MLSSVCYFSCNVSYSVKAQIWERASAHSQLLGPRRELKTEIWTTLRIITILWRLRLTARLNTTEENTHQTNAFSFQRCFFFLSYGHKKSARCASLCIAHPQKRYRNSKLPSKEGARHGRWPRHSAAAAARPRNNTRHYSAQGQKSTLRHPARPLAFLTP